MEILSIIAISLAGVGLAALITDKIVSHFREKSDPTAKITVRSSCCIRKDNHSRRHSHDTTTSSS